MLEPALYRKFCKIAAERAGIRIRRGKESLMTARVAKRQRALGIETPREYLRYLQANATGDEFVQFLNAITTNYTSFYREPKHFELLAKSFLELYESGQRRFRYWSAASSSGEEPYTMAISLLEALNGRRADIRILATDLSTKVLAEAERGIYEEQTLEPVGNEKIARYFTKQETVRGVQLYKVKPELRRLILYKRLNLSVTPFPMAGPLDFVFCRNVMIYFDTPVRQRLVNEVVRLLRPDGQFIIGQSETLTGIDCPLEVLRPSVYRRLREQRRSA